MASLEGAIKVFAAHTIGTDHRQEHAPLVVRASAKIHAVSPNEDEFKIVGVVEGIPCIESSTHKR